MRRAARPFSGALTLTEALAAHEAGADMVKLFPARFGGPQYLRDILGRCRSCGSC